MINDTVISYHIKVVAVFILVILVTKLFDERLFGYMISISVSAFGTAMYENSVEVIHVKGITLETNSYHNFIKNSSKDLFDEFNKSCFDNGNYSEESREHYYRTNSKHFNNLLQNELKSE
jgi:hypothetical protein